MAAQGPMAGKICLVTGATSGVGFETARELASRGATTIMGARTAERGAGPVRRIRADTGNERVELLIGDLSLMADVRRLAAQLINDHGRLDVLINNAGAYFHRRQETAEGLETTFALDALSPFLLTTLLAGALKEGAPSRVVNVASRAHRWGRIDLADVESKRHYRGFPAYFAAKLALVMISYELARRLEPAGVSVNTVHPGFVATRFGQNNGGFVGAAIGLGSRLFGRAPAAGADTVVYLCTSPQLDGVTGRYSVDRKAVPSSRSSYDPQLTAGLFRICEQMSGQAGWRSP
jgi:NAD(P)-dependent dehydrogenase (short-subunit alcohol dehydrogenase family)